MRYERTARRDRPFDAVDSAGDRLAALFEAHVNRLYYLARRLVPSADDALYLVQETFLKATTRANVFLGV